MEVQLQGIDGNISGQRVTELEAEKAALEASLSGLKDSVAKD